jgi:hypothetical protein
MTHVDKATARRIAAGLPSTGTSTPTDPACPGTRHGTRTAYDQWGCRCPEARADMQRLRRRVPNPAGMERLAPNPFDPEVDEIAVAKAMAGEPVRVTVRERAIAVERLTRQGLSAVDIGIRLGVVRYRTGVGKRRRIAEAA